MVDRTSSAAVHPNPQRSSPDRAAERRPPRFRLIQVALLGGLGAVAVLALIRFSPFGEAPLPETMLPEGQVLPEGDDFKLPDRPVEIEVDQLRGELEDLAVALPKEFPQDPAAHHFAAQIRSELKQTQLAQALWRRCLELDPKHLGAMLGWVELLKSEGRDAEAIKAATDGVAAHPNNSRLRLLRAEAYENTGDLTAARDDYLAATELPNPLDAWLGVGRVQNQLQQFELAEAALRKVLEQQPSNRPALIALQQSLVRQRKTEAAQAIQNQLVEATQKSAGPADGFQEAYQESLRQIARDIFLSVGTLYEAHQQIERATEWYRRSVQLDPFELHGYVALAAVDMKLERFAEAIAIQQRLIALQPENVLNYLNLASVAIQTGNIATAEAALRAGIEFELPEMRASMGLVRLYIVSGRADEALDLALYAVQRQPNQHAYEMLAAAEEANGNRELAQAAHQKATELSGGKQQADP